jgi:hypothetical protein
MIDFDSLILKPNNVRKVIEGIPKSELYANMSADLLNYRYFDDDVGIYRGDWSLEIGEENKVLSIMLDVHEEWDFKFASSMSIYLNLEVIGFEYLDPLASSANERILELRVFKPTASNITNGEYHAWPLSRFYSPSKDRLDEFILLDFWSLIDTKAEQPASQGFGPKSGPHP